MRISDWSSDVCSSDLALWSSDTTTVRPLSRVFVAMGSFQASVSAAWAVDASSRPASNSITCRVRTEFSLFPDVDRHGRSEEHTSELQSLMRISYAVF